MFVVIIGSPSFSSGDAMLCSHRLVTCLGIVCVTIFLTLELHFAFVLCCTDPKQQAPGQAMWCHSWESLCLCLSTLLSAAVWHWVQWQHTSVSKTVAM